MFCDLRVRAKAGNEAECTWEYLRWVGKNAGSIYSLMEQVYEILAPFSNYLHVPFRRYLRFKSGNCRKTVLFSSSFLARDAFVRRIVAQFS